MNTKNLKIPLIVLTIIVWGLIIVKIISVLRNSTVVDVKKSISLIDQTKIIVKDTFSISLQYNDPFLNTPSDRYNAKKIVSKNKYKIEPDNKLQTGPKWPDIKYNGQVFNASKKRSTGLLIIAQKQFLVIKGEKYNDVYVDFIFADSIRLIYDNEIKLFKKE